MSSLPTIGTRFGGYRLSRTSGLLACRQAGSWQLVDIDLLPSCDATTVQRHDDQIALCGNGCSTDSNILKSVGTYETVSVASGVRDVIGIEGAQVVKIYVHLLALNHNAVVGNEQAGYFDGSFMSEAFRCSNRTHMEFLSFFDRQSAGSNGYRQRTCEALCKIATLRAGNAFDASGFSYVYPRRKWRFGSGRLLSGAGVKQGSGSDAATGDEQEQTGECAAEHDKGSKVEGQESAPEVSDFQPATV